MQGFVRAVAAAIGMLLLVVLGFPVALTAVVEAPSESAAAYGHDGQHSPGLVASEAFERGPPVRTSITSTYDAADRWSSGTSARSGRVGSPTGRTYDDLGEAVQVVVPTVTTSEVTRGIQRNPGLATRRHVAANGGTPPSRSYDRPSVETKSGKAVKAEDVTDEWDRFLGPGQTNIDPRDGLPDPDRIRSADGSRSVRFGSHEVSGSPNKWHFHYETWSPNLVENVLQRIQGMG